MDSTLRSHVVSKTFSFLRSLEDEKGLLEVVMSQPVQRDIKKVESVTVPSVVGVKPIGNGVKDKDEGPTEKHSDER